MTSDGIEILADTDQVDDLEIGGSVRFDMDGHSRIAQVAAIMPRIEGCFVRLTWMDEGPD